MYFPQKISCIHQLNAHPDKGIMQNSYLRKEALIGLLAVYVSAIVNKKRSICLQGFACSKCGDKAVPTTQHNDASMAK